MSEHKTAKKPAITVMEPTRSGSIMTRKRLLVLAGACVLLVGALCGAAWLIVGRQQDSSVEQAAKPKVKQYSVSELMQMQDTSRDPNQLVTTMEGQEGDSSQKRVLLANAYVRDKQYDKAFAIFDDMTAKKQLSYGQLVGAAEYAVSYKQDYAKALNYYKAALTVAEADRTTQLRQNNIDNAKAGIKDAESKLAGGQ